MSPASADARSRRLLARIRRRYATTTEPLQFRDIQLQFTRAADPNRVLDEIAAEEDRRERLAGRRFAGNELHLPYWAELWDSALGLAQWLAESGWSARLGGGASVMDLGCGMGLCGTVAARLGARVLFVDLETPPLLFAILNSLPDRGRVRARRMNWRVDRLTERFDLILGADILYERSQWPYLDTFWKAHLSTGGAVLLGEPGRPLGDEFSAFAAGHGWKVIQRQQPVVTQKRPIRIFELAG